MKVFLKTRKIAMTKIRAACAHGQAFQGCEHTPVKAELGNQLLAPTVSNVWKIRLQRTGHFYNQLSRGFLKRWNCSHDTSP